MPKTIIDIAIEAELQDCTNAEKKVILVQARQIKQDNQPTPERRKRTAPFRNHVIIISSFPFAISLMMMSNPIMTPFLLSIAPVSIVLGAAGIWLARLRGIRIADRFLSLMLISLGLATLCFAPVLAIDVTVRNVNPVVAASFLYGITLTIYLTLCYGLYGVVINFQRSPRYNLVEA